MQRWNCKTRSTVGNSRVKVNVIEQVPAQVKPDFHKASVTSHSDCMHKVSVFH